MIEIFSELLIELWAYLFFPGLLYFLIGFFYHYFRNKSYWNIIIESTIIGAVLAFFIQPVSIFFGWAEWTLISILIVLTSGILAFAIRKSSLKSSKNHEKDDKNDSKANIKKINYKEHKLIKEGNIEDKFLKSSTTKQDNDVDDIIQQLTDNRWQNRYQAIISLINRGDSSAIEDVRKLLDDENSIVRKTAATYLRANDAFPKTRPEDIKLYPFDIKNSYASIKSISAHSDDSLDSESNMDDVKAKLREEAANLGANAIIEVNYGKGFFNRGKWVKAQGNAVFVKNMENVERNKPSLVNPLFLGFLWMTLGLSSYYLYDFENNYRLIYVLLGLYFIFNGFSNHNGYKNKTYFLALFCISIASVLILIVYILKNGFQYGDIFFTVAFGIIPIIFIYEYLTKENNQGILWKNEWGF